MAETKRGGKRTGSGRKQSADGPTVVVSVSVPSALMSRVDTVATGKDWSRSATMTEAVRLLLKKHERKAGESNPASTKPAS